MSNQCEPDDLLYKYRSLSGEFGRLAAKDAILHGRMHWQSPVSFNDPMDCKPVFVFGSDANSRVEFRKRVVASQRGKKPRQERRRVLKKLQKQGKNEFEQRMTVQWDSFMQNSAVACFSKTNDNPLLWAHYAASHTGICLIFGNAIGPDPWFGFAVEYQEKRPKVDLTTFRKTETYKRALLTKSSDWSYEKEIRMTDWNKGSGYRPIPDGMLRGVILGARIEQDDREFMLGLLERKPTLEKFQAEIDKEHFRININCIT